MPRGVYDHYKIRKICKIKDWNQYENLEYYPDRVCRCGCGGRIQVQSHHKYYGIPEYSIGHHRRGKKRSNDVIERIKRSNRETWKNPELRKRHSKATKLLWEDPEYKKNHCEVLIGHVVSKEAKKNMSDAHVGKKQSRGQIEKRLRTLSKVLRIKPNKVEGALNDLLQELLPNQWKYVGDCQFILAGKNPDFVHVSQKKIIELYGDYWHGEEKTGRPKMEEEQQRIDLFAQHGYQTLIIWEHELNDIRNLTSKLLNFTGEVENNS